MALILVCHGAWSGGWSWKKMRGPLKALGHDLLTPTYTGLGERTHLINPMIDLEVHIRDVLGVVTCEDLRDFVLLGHSYGGMVATGVADRASERIVEMIYLDAFVPENGQSLFDLRPDTADAARRSATAEGDGWFLPPGPLAPDILADDRDWLTTRRGRQPLKTFEQKLVLAGKAASLPKSYIYCRKKGDDDPFRAIAERVRELPGWRYFEMESGHVPNITMPEALATLIDGIVSAGGARG